MISSRCRKCSCCRRTACCGSTGCPRRRFPCRGACSSAARRLRLKLAIEGSQVLVELRGLFDPLLGILQAPRPVGVQQIRQLNDRNKGRGHGHKHGPATAWIAHQRGQPTLKLSGQRRDHQKERRGQGQRGQQQPTLGKWQSQGESAQNRDKDNRDSRMTSELR